MNNKLKKIAACFLACIMVFCAISAVSAEEQTRNNDISHKEVTDIIVSASAVNGDKFIVNEEEITVSSNEAEKLGYDDLLTDGVSALDVLVKMHEIIYGSHFTAENANDYLSIPYGYISCVFGEATSSVGYRINGMSAQGISEELSDGGSFELYFYQDTQYWSDIYVRTEDIETAAGEPIIIKAENGGTALAGVQLAYVDKYDIIPIEGAIADNDGCISIAFDRPGIYYVTLRGTFNCEVNDYSSGEIVMVDSPIIPSIIRIRVTPPENEVMPEEIYIKTAETIQSRELAYGSEWSVMGLARAGYQIPDTYYHSVMNAVDSGMVSKATDIEKIIIAITASGYRVDDTLLEKLSSASFVKKGGLMSSIYALLAFDSGNYDIPVSADQNTRDIMIQSIISAQKSDGGFSLTSNWDATVDTTAMAVQALAKYRGREDVAESIDKAFQFIENNINADEDNSPDKCSVIAQVIIACTELNKNPVIYVEQMLRYYGGNGQFTYNGKENIMTTIQAYYAMVSYYRWIYGENTLYDMSDAYYDIISSDGRTCIIYAPFNGETAIVKADYMSHVLTGIDIINMRLMKGKNKIEIIGGDRFMLWDSINNMRPLCEVYCR